MTFYYAEEDNQLVGNNAFHNRFGFAEVDGDSIVIDVDYIMDEGRALSKLNEMKNSIEAAIEANESDL